MGTSDEVNITWTWILQPRHSRHRTTHGSLIGAGFGRQRSLKVFPALAPAAPQAPGFFFARSVKRSPGSRDRGFFFVSAIAAAQQCSRFSGDKLDDVGAKPNTLRCRAEAPAVPGFVFCHQLIMRPVALHWPATQRAASTATRQPIGVALASASCSQHIAAKVLIGAVVTLVVAWLVVLTRNTSAAPGFILARLFLAIGTELAGSPSAHFLYPSIHRSVYRWRRQRRSCGFASADIVPRTSAAAAIANLHICPTPKRYGASIKAIWKRKIEPTLCSLQGALAGRSPCER